jgi:RimJ/RimL family protein N-acetyltransferase
MTSHPFAPLPQTISLRGGLHAELSRTVEADAAAVVAYFNQVSAETDFAAFGGGGYPRNAEEEVLHLRSLAQPSKGLMLKGVISGELAGIVGINRLGAARVQHNGILGISVLKKYWSVGLGRALCEAAILEARQIGLLRIELRTRHDNHRAIALYEALGFQHEGRLRGAFKVDEAEYDDLLMALRLHAEH